MQKIKKEAIDLLCQLVRIPAYSRDEKAKADFLQQHIEKTMGYKTNRLDNNIWIQAADFRADRPTLLLNAHIDTVKPVNGWQREPHTDTHEDGKIYGLGTNDDGASLVSLLYAFSVLSKKEQPYNLIYAASAEEEVSGKNGMEKLLTVLPKIDVAIVGEPTGMHAAVAEKGLMVLDCVAHGKAGHAARNEGDNAIYKAIKDIEWIKDNVLPKQTDLLGPVKWTTTMINAGTQHNVIPDACSFVVDIRSNECYSNEEIFEILQSKLQSEIKARSFRLSSSSISVEHPIVKKIKSMGRNLFGSPTLSDQALMRFPSVKFGPGDSSRSHTADEFIFESEIEEAIEMYVELLDGLSIG